MSVNTDPAIKSYFFGKGYTDLLNTIKGSWKKNIISAKNFFSKIDRNGEWWEATLSVLFWGGAGVSVVIFGTVFFCIISLLHILILGLFFGLIYLAFSILWAVEKIFLFSRSYFMACPHCHTKTRLPEYWCDSCGKIHKHLMPNSYGILSHRCQCGQELPATFFKDRGSLQARCPACQEPLHRDHVESKRIFIPIVGGPSVGKTAFMFSVVQQLIEKKASILGLQTEFINSATEAQYKSVHAQLEKGASPSKTTDKIPKAFNLALKDGATTKCLFYIYDPAGEAYEDGAAEDLSAHLYYEYLSGLVMIIDPFSIPAVRRMFEKELSTTWSEVKPSQLHLEDALNRMLLTLEESFSLAKTKQVKKPLAVVINKIDAFNLENIIGEPAVDRALSLAGGEADKNYVRNNLIRKQLEDWGEEALLQQINVRFKKVSFFTCSALGRIPDSTGEKFISHDVFEPIQWIIDSVNNRKITDGYLKAS